MRTFEVVIWNTVNISRDIDKNNPEVEQHCFIINAENEEKAYEKAKNLHFQKTKKGVWEHEIYEA
jgi:hypothetical protein